MGGQLAVPMLAGAEGAEFFCGLGNAPANALVVLDGEAPLFGFLLEAAVMVGAVPAGVLDSVLVTVHMGHFVDEGCYDVGRGAVQAFGSQVDFSEALALPGAVHAS